MIFRVACNRERKHYYIDARLRSAELWAIKKAILEEYLYQGMGAASPRLTKRQDFRLRWGQVMLSALKQGLAGGAATAALFAVYALIRQGSVGLETLLAVSVLGISAMSATAFILARRHEVAKPAASVPVPLAPPSGAIDRDTSHLARMEKTLGQRNAELSLAKERLRQAER